MRKFRFGAKAVVASSRSDWCDEVSRIEGHGYQVLITDEHIKYQLTPFPALAVAAATSSSLDFGTIVTGVDFRNPTILGREAWSVDLLSDGRFFLGVGAGWKATDYAASGIAMDRPSVRIERLGEAIDVMRLMWSSTTSNYEGVHYRLTGLEGGRCVSDGGIPILIGGGGRKILTLAAQKADIVSINGKVVGGTAGADTMQTLGSAYVDERLGWVREAAGLRFGSIELHMQIIDSVVVEGRTERAATLSALAAKYGISEETVASSPYIQVGPLSLISEQMQAIREQWGVSFFSFEPGATAAMAPLVDLLSGT